MRWLVEGCLKWQREGLNPPEEVIQATNEYRNESDKFQNWIEECCVIEVHAVASSSELYKSFQAWSLANGEKFIVNSKVFGKHLVQKGFESFKGTGGARKMRGIGLMANERPEKVAEENPF